jgi:hypothetical protein
MQAKILPCRSAELTLVTALLAIKLVELAATCLVPELLQGLLLEGPEEEEEGEKAEKGCAWEKAH